jgi:hypothetical protein
MVDDTEYVVLSATTPEDTEYATKSVVAQEDIGVYIQYT